MPKNSEPASTGAGKYARSKMDAGNVHGAEALADISATVMRDAIAAVLTQGDAILLGCTRDGGAVAIALYSGEAVDKMYASTPEEVQELFQGILDLLKDS